MASPLQNICRPWRLTAWTLSEYVSIARCRSSSGDLNFQQEGEAIHSINTLSSMSIMTATLILLDVRRHCVVARWIEDRGVEADEEGRRFGIMP